MSKIDSNFRNPERAKQLNSFRGILFERGIRPTDIDGSIDFGYGKKGFVFLEVKYKDNTMDDGQRDHLEALTRYTSTPAWALHISHNIEETTEEVTVKDCVVREVCINGEWTDIYNGRDALDIINEFVKINCPKYLPID